LLFPCSVIVSASSIEFGSGLLSEGGNVQIICETRIDTSEIAITCISPKRSSKNGTRKPPNPAIVLKKSLVFFLKE